MSSIVTNSKSSPSSGAAGPPAAPTSNDQRADRLSSILSVTQGLIPLLVAIVILWWFGTVIKQMFTYANSTISAETWSRYTYLYSGLEAIAYAAAGFLFGREVNRQRADRAEQSAARSQDIAFEAQSTAAVSEANGQALAAGVRAIHANGTMHPERGAEAGTGGGTVDVTILRSMADTLFPSKPHR